MITQIYDYLTNMQIERIDQIITEILIKATKSIQGIRRNIPYSKQKVLVRAEKLYWKDKCKEKRGMYVNEEKMEARRKLAMISDENITSYEQIKDKAIETDKKWKELLEKGHEIREKEILEFYHSDLANKNEADKRKRKKIINNIVKSQQRLHTLHFLTRHAGKGIKGCFKKLIVKDENGSDKTITDRKEIEHNVMDFNQKFFKAPTETKVYKDKIYDKLSDPSIRDKIIDGTLRRSECDDEDVFAFLKILKKPEGLTHSSLDQITEEMFVTAVKRS